MDVVALPAAARSTEAPDRGERRRHHGRDHEDHPVRRDDAGGSELQTLKSHVDAEFKARLRIEGPNGSFDLKLKVELDDVDSATFGAALQGFTETLQAALHSVNAGGTATDDGNADATTTRVQLKLRLSYTRFEDSTASGLQRLARPDAASSGAVAPEIFGDLAQRFAALQQAAAPSLAEPLTLGGFLQALAERFKLPVTAPAPAPADTATEPEPGPVAAPVFSITRLRFAAEYQAVSLAA